MKNLGLEFTRKIQGNKMQLAKLERSQRAAINAQHSGRAGEPDRGEGRRAVTRTAVLRS